MRRRHTPRLDYEYVKISERVHLLERIVQAIGFTPDFPYTLNVNDGTRNRVLIGKINGDYGIKIVSSTGAEVILANGTINADAIQVGSLDGDIITAGTIDADKLTVGTINATSACVSSLHAGWITVGTMDGEHIQEGTMHANRIEAGTITAGQLAADTIITQSIQIGDDLIGTGHITSITGSKIEVGTLDANRIVAGTITTDRIAARQITTDRIAIGGVNYNEIANDAIRNQHVHDLSADKITAGTITGRVFQTHSTNKGFKLWTSSYGVTADAYMQFWSSEGVGTGFLYKDKGTGHLTLDYMDFNLNGGDIWEVDTLEVRSLEANGSLDILDVVGFHGDVYFNNVDLYSIDHIQAGALTIYHLDSQSSYIDVWDEIRCHAGSSGCGFIELGLMKDKSAESIDRFSEGDVLIWKGGQLEKCKSNMCRQIVAVAGKDGRPVIFGAEKIKVTGKIEEGDFLVGSGLAGYARAEKFPVLGSVIAQALENSSGGEQLIKAMIWRM